MGSWLERMDLSNWSCILLGTQLGQQEEHNRFHSCTDLGNQHLYIKHLMRSFRKTFFSVKGEKK
jgi:hypothetical protein